MTFTLMHVLCYLLILDSLGAIWSAWFAKKWFIHHMGPLAGLFPPAKGWTAWYFILAVALSFATGAF